MDRRRLIILPVFIVLLLCVAAAALGDNPFMGGTAVEKSKRGLNYPLFVKRFMRKIGLLQRNLNERMTSLGKEIKTKENPRAAFMLFALVFAYGVVHALGPGHGKTVSGSYFLTRRATVKNGIILGSVIALIHAVSAVSVVLVLYFILKKGIGVSMEHYSRVVKIISAGAIVLIGLFLFARRILKKVPSERESLPRDRSILLIALAVGIVPCPGAVLILLFSMSMDIIGYGVLLAFVMSLGMALTISVTCCAVITAKKGIFGSGEERGVRRTALFSVEITGAVIVVLFGTFLLAGAV
ncbi:MAG: hypothetical protein JXQ30_02135 [Spirochaetes bacterium]|nr:hypothetical protein [Spirochaetota bacterium]